MWDDLFRRVTRCRLCLEKTENLPVQHHVTASAHFLVALRLVHLCYTNVFNNNDNYNLVNLSTFNLSYHIHFTPLTLYSSY